MEKCPIGNNAKKRTISKTNLGYAGTKKIFGKFYATQWSDILQAKLAISKPDDEYEKEADHVAEQVMNMPQSTASSTDEKVKRKCRRCEEKEEIHRKATSNINNMIPDNLGIDSLQGGSALDSSTRTFMESRFDFDFSNVRIHTDERAARSAKAFNALAYTVGQDIIFDSGEYQPDTIDGRRLLAHELAHVVQQNNVNRSTNIIWRFTDEQFNPEYREMYEEWKAERKAEREMLQNIAKEMNNILKEDAAFMSALDAPLTWQGLPVAGWWGDVMAKIVEGDIIIPLIYTPDTQAEIRAAEKMCDNIAQKAKRTLNEAIAQNRLTGVSSVDTICRDIQIFGTTYPWFHHVANSVILADGTEWVFDWWDKRDVDNPTIMSVSEWLGFSYVKSC